MPNFDPTFSDGMPTSLCDASGKRVLVGEGWADYLQRPIDDLMGAPWKAVVHPDDRSIFEQHWTRLVESGLSYRTSMRLSRGSGLWATCCFSVAEICSPTTGGRLFQSNVYPLPMTEGPSQATTGVIANADFTAYVAEIAAELARVAGEQRLPLLQHLLAMASTEAALHARNDTANGEAMGALVLGTRLH